MRRHPSVRAAMPPRKEDRSSSEVRAGHALFDQPWWIEAVAPGSWREAVVQDEGGTHARLPFVERRRLGIVVLTQPPLTPTLGPWVQAQAGSSPSKTLALEHRRMRELIQALPRFDLFRQHFSPAVQNWLPFYWAGFDATVTYTYRIDDLADLDRVWTRIRHETRRYVRRASESLSVRNDLGLGAFLEINDWTFERQGLQRPYPSALVERLDAACAAHGAREILFAVDAGGRVHAAVYLVWDSSTAYLLMSGQHPALRSSGAMSLLVWEAIKFSSTVTRAFDFEGSMIPSIEQFYRHFGARQVPYLFVTKGNLKGRAADAVRPPLESAARALRGAAAKGRHRRDTCRRTGE